MKQNSDNLIEIRDLCFSRATRVVFDGVNIIVRRGKVTAVMGPSGSGKTTLLKLIGGQLKPDSGEISMSGENIPDLSHNRLYEIRRRMGMLFQSAALFSDLSVFENVAFPLREHTDLPEEMIRD